MKSLAEYRFAPVIVGNFYLRRKRGCRHGLENTPAFFSQDNEWRSIAVLLLDQFLVYRRALRLNMLSVAYVECMWTDCYSRFL